MSCYFPVLCDSFTWDLARSIQRVPEFDLCWDYDSACGARDFGSSQLFRDSPAKAGMLLGRVWEILPCGIRVQRILAQTPVEEYFWAPTLEVDPAILQTRCSPVHFPEALVSFQVAQGSGTFAAEGRARCVRRASFESEASKSEQFERTASPLVQSRPRAQGTGAIQHFSEAAALVRGATQPKCLTIISAVDAWKRPILEQNVCEASFCSRSLERSIEEATGNDNGAFMCHLLLCCVAGVKVCLEAQLWFAESSGQASLSFFSFLQRQEILLVRLASRSLSRLDLGHIRVRHAIRQALRFCHDIVTGLARSKKPMPDAWREMGRWVHHGLVRGSRCVGTPQRPKPLLCTAKGCTRKGHQVQLTVDALGPSGWRCRLHGPKLLCNVDGCNRLRSGSVSVKDLFGEAGGRCITHGARSCEVDGCFRFARVRVYLPDEFGLSGRRCLAHCPGCRCTVANCHYLPIGRVRAPDIWGQAGYRCRRHGFGCSVPGCTKIAWGRVQTDILGPAGRRCWIHGGKTCNIPGCSARPVRRVKHADAHAEAGIRCEKHSCSLDRAGPKRPRFRMSLKPNESKEFKADSGALTRPSKPQLSQLSDEARCVYSDGNSWRCRRPRKGGQRVCEYHWTKRVEYDRQRRNKPKDARKSAFGTSADTCDALN